MAETTLMRVSKATHEVVTKHAATEDRTLVAELDRIVEAGVAALYGPPKGKRKAS